jgi:DNA-binding CsgD family transcriptional regulator
LVGRRAECERLESLIAAARAVSSGALVVRGDAGVGKSALLDYLLAHAAGCRIARAAGVESEMELAFAGLHQLCRPFLDRIERLPAPQRNALATAFGLERGEAPDRFLVGLAVLGLLSDVAETQPLVCLLDDAQWLDRTSVQVLGFVARRLAQEAVVLVFAMRDSAEDRSLAGLLEMNVPPLRDGDARSLLAAAIPGRLDELVRDRIVAEAHGNPLALLELPRAWSPAALAGGFGLPDGMSVASRIEESIRLRLASLPDQSRRLLLMAAADPVGDPTLIRIAADRLGISLDAAGPATATGLIDDVSSVRFRHPVVRSVVYREAPAADRRLVHAALADATDAVRDPDRRAWHRAAAAGGPDEDVALELERSAGRAQSRGGLAAAAAFLERAVALTDDRTLRAGRALVAAQASIQTGAFDAVRGLLQTAEKGPLEPFQRAMVDLLRAQLAFASSRGNEAVPWLLEAAQRLESLDPRLARETYVDAFSAALFGARLNDGIGLAEVADVARAAPRPADGEARAADLLLDALIGLSGDYPAAVAPGRAALRKLSSETVTQQERLRWLWQGCVVALELWDDEHAWVLSHRSVEIARETGTLGELALALSAHSPVLVLTGDLSSAALSVAETQSVEEATGIRAAPYGAMILAAWRGQARETEELIEVTSREALFRGEGVALAVSDYARAVLSNGLGNYDEAFAAARSASAYQEVVVENWGLSELVEPASRTGRLDLAAAALDRLAIKAKATGTGWVLGVEARSRALLSQGHVAEAHFRAAVEHLGTSRVRTELARTHLLYGEWLRREGRRVDARAELRTAYEMFMAIGMEAFLERARRELLATGETVRKRSVETLDELTPQEVQIARLARDGRTNPEIGAQLFLSSRTVEWHLRKVFAKLGVTSRKALREAMAGGTLEMTGR